MDANNLAALALDCYRLRLACLRKSPPDLAVLGMLCARFEEAGLSAYPVLEDALTTILDGLDELGVIDAAVTDLLDAVEDAILVVTVRAEARGEAPAA